MKNDNGSNIIEFRTALVAIFTCPGPYSRIFASGNLWIKNHIGPHFSQTISVGNGISSKTFTDDSDAGIALAVDYFISLLDNP